MRSEYWVNNYVGEMASPEVRALLMNPKTRDIERIIMNKDREIVNQTFKDLMAKHTDKRKELYVQPPSGNYEDLAIV